MKESFGKLLVGLALVAGAGAWASNQELIRDVEGLRNSLPLKDPSRQSLTLRLADLYFDLSTELGANPVAPEATVRQLQEARKKAVALYTEALKGTEYQAGIGGDLAYKVKFQLARLFADQGQHALANPLWKELVEQKSIARLRQESALRLAEYHDSTGNLDEADKSYRLSLELCAGGDICSYIQYRRAWLLRNGGDLDAGIEAMKSALYDSKGRVREEALRDLVVFLGARPDDGTKALPEVEELSRKLSRPNLIQDLSDSFFASGNRPAGTHVLAYLNARQPTLDAQVRLLEEYYGSRNWEKFRAILDETRARPGTASTDEKDVLNRGNIMKRLLVQLDGERQSNKAAAADFKSAVELYLQLYPVTADTLKMMEGWLAAEPDVAGKAERLKTWEADAVFATLPEKDRKKLSAMRLAAEIKLHRDRAAAAQKSEDQDALIAEVTTLLGLETAPEAQRELNYLRARAHYVKKDFANALPAFRALAAVSGKPDKWAILSQHLALDILGKEKRYGEVVAQVDGWTKNAAVQKTAASDKELARELAAMAVIGNEARFQEAVAHGETPAALALFESFCQKGEFLPKSCENAKVLAVKLKKQGSLIAVLNKLGSKAELAAEYEAAGYFAEAGKLLEELDLAKPQATTPFLKVALMYELGNQLLERNRVLTRLVVWLKGKKDLGPEEPLIYQTLKDAGLVNAETYKLPWSTETRARAAAYLEDLGQGTAATRKDVLLSQVYTGKGWERAVLEVLADLDEKQRKISFHGRASQARFERRLKALKDLTAALEKYYPGAPAETRVKMAELVAKAHEDLAAAILATPIPPELTGEAVDEVKNALATMAQPFQEKGQEYARLVDGEAQKVAQSQATAAPAAPQASAPAPLAVDVRQLLANLHDNPMDRDALEGVKRFYESKGNERLAAYFQGRLLQLGQGDKEEGT